MQSLFPMLALARPPVASCVSGIYTVQRISPWRTQNHASSHLPHSLHASETASKSACVARPAASDVSANALFKVRSAHRSLHHATSSAVL